MKRVTHKKNLKFFHCHVMIIIHFVDQKYEIMQENVKKGFIF